MIEPSELTKIKMLEDAGYSMTLLASNYEKAVNFIKSVTNMSCCNVCDCIPCKAVEILREIGEETK